MLGSWCWDCNKSHALISSMHTHKFRHSSNSEQNISSCPCRSSQKPCSRRTIQESSLQGRKKIKSNVTSEKSANIWEMKPKWISLAYFSRIKQLISLLLPSVSYRQTVERRHSQHTHAALQKTDITCIMGQVLHTNTCISSLYSHNGMKTNRRAFKNCTTQQLL